MEEQEEGGTILAQRQASSRAFRQRSGRRKDREGGRFERRDLLYLSGVHALP